jgi:hypothetical protein
MGMGWLDVELLIRLRNEGHFSRTRSVIEIGAQQASNSLLDARDQLSERLSESFNVSRDGWPLPGRLASSFNAEGMEMLPQNAPPMRPFWEWLDFGYAAIDVDGSPGAVPLDLNYDSVPRRWKGKFGLATNYGTTEHVCNQLNAFKVIHDLLETGGVMVHTVPAQGFFCHGLVNYNMKFFWMLARSNNYKWLYGSFSQGNSVDIHTDVVNDVKRFDQSILSRRPGAYSDGGIRVAMQKIYRHEFVAPLDVPNDVKAPTRSFGKRYWTVFHPKRAFLVRAPRAFLRRVIKRTFAS